MKVVIDRFEGKFAVCEGEDGRMLRIERSGLPAGAKEGDVLSMEQEGISMDEKRTSERKAEIKKLMDDVWE